MEQRDPRPMQRRAVGYVHDAISKREIAIVRWGYGRGDRQRGRCPNADLRHTDLLVVVVVVIPHCIAGKVVADADAVSSKPIAP